MSDQVNVNIDGQKIQVETGKTVGAALVQAGITSWRITRHDSKPRGIFCGIGICYDCLVTVNGEPNQRACLVPVSADMQVQTQQPEVATAKTITQQGGDDDE